MILQIFKIVFFWLVRSNVDATLLIRLLAKRDDRKYWIIYGLVQLMECTVI